MRLTGIWRELKSILESRAFSSVSEFKLATAVATGSPLANVRSFPPFLTLRALNSVIYRPWRGEDRIDNLTANLILFVEEKYADLKDLDTGDFMRWLKNSSFRHQELGGRLLDCLEKAERRKEADRRAEEKKG